MSHPKNPDPPDYARIYKELDEKNPGWRDNIADRTGERPGEPHVFAPSKDSLRPQTGAPATPPPAKVGLPAQHPTNVTEVKPTPKAEDTESKRRERVLADEQAKEKSLQDLKQRGQETQKGQAMGRGGSSTPTASIPGPANSHVERLQASAPKDAVKPATPSTSTTWVDRTGTSPQKQSTLPAPPAPKSWVERTGTAPTQTGSLPKPPTPAPGSQNAAPPAQGQLPKPPTPAQPTPQAAKSPTPLPKGPEPGPGTQTPKPQTPASLPKPPAPAQTAPAQTAPAQAAPQAVKPSTPVPKPAAPAQPAPQAAKPSAPLPKPPAPSPTPKPPAPKPPPPTPRPRR